MYLVTFSRADCQRFRGHLAEEPGDESSAEQEHHSNQHANLERGQEQASGISGPGKA
jgi:hypothetical protein